MTNFAIASIFASVVLLFVFTFFSLYNYKVRFKMKYDLRNHYPYELNFESKYTDNLTGNIAITLFAFSGIIFYTLFDNSYNNGFFIFNLIAGSIYSLALAGLAFLPLKRLKLHLTLVLVCIVLGFLIPFSNGMAASMSYRNYQEASNLVMIILNALYCLFIFALMMNPKLSKWAELKEEKNPDGTVKYVRPKVFILAFIEWALLLSSPILMVLTLISKLVVK